MNAGRSPLTFFLLVFVLSIPFLLFAGTPLPGPLNLPVSAFMIVCPALAASILVRREEGAGGVARLLARVADFRKIRAVWYLPILLLMPAIMLLSYGVMLLSGRPLPADPFVPYLLIPVFVPLFFIAAAFEEIGWMGYAADPLQERRSALTTALIIGAVWAAWHSIPWLLLNTPTWAAGQALSTVALRVLIVWLYNNTRKSVFAATLFHGMMNVAEFSFPNLGSHYDPVVSGAIASAVAVVVVFLRGPETLAGWRYAHRRDAGR
ncbi:CPBP family intramembrane metalloprotease [Methanoculleus sp. Wushi-C6]|uniref:CPBP family intramembrane metalloprotease n=1 Tax=Methanoculleus caldifontis TaxID=2651577 RepID=A0ABU3X1G4_9EURY|nr:type II CAAX endopeptidase family protein [Methanoculleus sp. Wushi-C6]MDV2481904.1 CPBP family intramembrane metalloprotease [Methanoculleus sp. Wushi-C6]